MRPGSAAIATSRVHRRLGSFRLVAAAALTLVGSAMACISDGSRGIPGLPDASASSGGGIGGTGEGPASAGGAHTSGSDAGGAGGDTAAGPTCGAEAMPGLHCGKDSGLQDADAETLYACVGEGPAEVQETCVHGCIQGTNGADDFCALALPECPTKPLIKFGVCPDASDQFHCVGITASLITQTIGDFAASAGTHLQDGAIDGKPYCAATDLSVKALTNPQVKELVDDLATHGFAAFFRDPGKDGWPSTEARHIHAIYVGVAMKDSLKAQVEDWLAGLNGLKSHAPYSFYQASPAKKAFIQALFDAHN